MSNGLDQDHVVMPDLGPNRLQMLSADDTSRQRVKHMFSRCSTERSHQVPTTYNMYILSEKSGNCFYNFWRPEISFIICDNCIKGWP